MPTWTCPICGEIDGGSFNHDLDDDAAFDVGTAECPKCGKDANARCSWGTGGDAWFVCACGAGFHASGR